MRPLITIYKSSDDRVTLNREVCGCYSVTIAGADYGPLNWSDALAWYRRHSAPALHSYNVEVTDTFCGEANYSWIRRYSIRARDLSHAVRVGKAAAGYAGVRCNRSDFGDSVWLDPRGECVRIFILEGEGA